MPSLFYPNKRMFSLTRKKSYLFTKFVLKRQFICDKKKVNIEISVGSKSITPTPLIQTIYHILPVGK